MFWILGSVLDSGKCFWILGSVLDSKKCFDPMGHRIVDPIGLLPMADYRGPAKPMLS